MQHSGIRKLTVLPLAAATFFMVSGGAYGLEEMIQKVGYGSTLLVLAVLPFVWSLPTVLMLTEMSTALPCEGGYYVWVRRALGPFWGFMAAWLALLASVFDMAVYPTMFVLYLAKFWAPASDPLLAKFIGISLIVACLVWNLRGAGAVGNAAVFLVVTLALPFGCMTIAASLQGAAATPPAAPVRTDLLGALVIGMWNFMGWDNASTLAGEVERPQRTYPRAMFIAIGLVTLSYLLPVAAASRSGIAADQWTTGTWVDAAAIFGGPVLAQATICGGLLSAVGMLNALILSYSRLPMVLAEDGLLPRVLAKRLTRTQVPHISLMVCALGWALALGNDLERLLSIDVACYGAALLLQFASLIALRYREPELPRPFSIPLGIPGLTVLATLPALLLAAAVTKNLDFLPDSSHGSLVFLALLLGPVSYWLARTLPQRRSD